MIKRLSIIHAHSPFITGWMGLRYARRYNIPFVYTYPTKLEEYAHYVPFDETATRMAAETLTRTFADMTDAVVVPTLAMGERLRELGVEARIEIIPTAIDLLKFGGGKRDPALRERVGAGGRRMLFFVSRLGREKNVDLLIAALARSAPDLHLVIGGDGPERDALIALATSLGVGDRTTFLGAIERDALPDLYASSDAFVFPSTTETQGLVLAEALAAGALVIAADAPTNRDVLGGAGRSPARRSQPLRAPSTTFPPNRMRPKPAGAAGAERFSIDAQAERMLTLYRSLWARSPATKRAHRS